MNSPSLKNVSVPIDKPIYNIYLRPRNSEIIGLLQLLVFSWLVLVFQLLVKVLTETKTRN